MSIMVGRELKWRTASGVYYYPWEMTDAHIKNCLLHIQEHAGFGAANTAWHQIFRCELKRREVQNAHQPPTPPPVQPPTPSLKNAIMDAEALWESLRRGWAESLGRMEKAVRSSKDLKFRAGRTRTRSTKKGRKTK